MIRAYFKKNITHFTSQHRRNVATEWTQHRKKALKSPVSFLITGYDYGKIYRARTNIKAIKFVIIVLFFDITMTVVTHLGALPFSSI